MPGEARWESRPIECWPRLRELRRQFVEEMWTAKERGDLLLMGGTGPMHCLPAGLGTYHFFGGLGPNFGRIAADIPLLARCMEAAEQAGYGPDCCSTLRACLGAMFVGQFDVSPRGERVQPDFQLDMQNCQAQGKTGQLWNEYYGVPNFYVEMPPTIRQADYLIGQMEEAIEWMQQVSGRSYQDELFIAAVKNEWECRLLYAQICELQKAIPAPLDQRQLWGINTLRARGGRHRPEVVAFLRVILDEVRNRVENHIAALGTERCRLMHEGVGTWYRSPVFAYPRDYGAVFIGSHQTYAGQGTWRMREDGSLELGPTIEELNLPCNTREEALHALAVHWLEYAPGVRCMNYLDCRVQERVKAAEDWHADAVVLTNDRGCRGVSVGNMETSLALKERGVPVMTYEGSSTDPSLFNQPEYMARMDAFMESLGLRRLETEVPAEQW